MEPTVMLLATLLSLTGGAVYGYVGWRLSRRRVEGPSRLAHALFITWWATLAVYSGVGALVRLGVVTGVVDFPMYATWAYVGLLLVCVALWALLYYLVYLLTGSRRAFAPITAFYALVFVALVYLLTAAQPRGLVVEGARVALDNERPLQGLPFALAYAGLFGPHLVALVGYFRLLFRVDTPTQRYRIGMVSLTFLGWFLSAILGALTQANATPWWLLASGLIGLVASLLILAAYVPPRWVRRRYGVAPLDEAEPAA